MPTPVAQPADVCKEQFNLRVGQGGRRLVEDQQPAVSREGRGDFDQLLLAHAQLPHGGCGMDIASPSGQRLPGLAVQGREVHETQRAAAD